MGFPPSAYNGWVARNYFSSLRPVAFFKARSRARSRNSGWLENELRSVCHPASKRSASETSSWLTKDGRYSAACFKLSAWRCASAMCFSESASFLSISRLKHPVLGLDDPAQTAGRGLLAAPR